MDRLCETKAAFALDPSLDILRAVDRGREVVSYHRFLLGEAREFDRYQEVNRRARPSEVAVGTRSCAEAGRPRPR